MTERIIVVLTIAALLAITVTIARRLFRSEEWHAHDGMMRRRKPDGSFEFGQQTPAEASEEFDSTAW